MTFKLVNCINQRIQVFWDVTSYHQGVASSGSEECAFTFKSQAV